LNEPRERSDGELARSPHRTDKSGAMSERKDRTKLGLSKYAADAAERVVEHSQPSLILTDNTNLLAAEKLSNGTHPVLTPRRDRRLPSIVT
jgi:hypothetical protein